MSISHDAPRVSAHGLSRRIRSGAGLLALGLCVASWATPARANPVVASEFRSNGVAAQVVKVDLTDPHTVLTIFLANQAKQANSPTATAGDEGFPAFVRRARAAVVMNGTFFSKDAQKRVMGNMVRNGQFVKYSRWENAGTTFGLRRGNQPVMTTARVEGQPDWQRHWFSITCGPRLVKDGQVWLHPREESFQDPHVFASAARSALGYSRDGKTLVPAGRALTQVIAVYDSRQPAPAALRSRFQSFTGEAGLPVHETQTVPRPFRSR